MTHPSTSTFNNKENSSWNIIGLHSFFNGLIRSLGIPPHFNPFEKTEAIDYIEINRETPRRRQTNDVDPVVTLTQLFDALKQNSDAEEKSAQTLHECVLKVSESRNTLFPVAEMLSQSTQTLQETVRISHEVAQQCDHVIPELSTLNTALKEKEEALENTNKRIDELVNLLKKESATLAQLQQSMQKLAGKNKQLTQKLKQQTSLINALETELRRCESTRDRLAELYMEAMENNCEENVRCPIG